MKTQRLIDKKTTEIVKKLKEELAGFYENFYLDLDSVLRHYDIELLEASFEDPNVSGILSKEGDRWSIIVNNDDSTTRRRFTVAHELGHYFAVQKSSEIAKTFLEKNEGAIKDYFVFNRGDEVEEEDYQVERQANLIAASVLMPEDMVKNLFDQKIRLEEMAKKFGVSESAMSYRLRSLKLIPIETMYS